MSYWIGGIIFLPIAVTYICMWWVSLIKETWGIPFAFFIIFILSIAMKHLRTRVRNPFSDVVVPSIYRNLLRDEIEELPFEAKDLLYRKFSKEISVNLHSSNSQENTGRFFDYIRNRVEREKDKLWKEFYYISEYYLILIRSRILWLSVAIINTLFCFSLYYIKSEIVLLIGVTVNTIQILVAWISGWFVLPHLLRSLSKKYIKKTLFSYIRST